MNIRELKPITRLLNNPREYLNTHFKLIFTYPILFTNGTQIPMNLVRDFVSYYYLKEIYVSNSLNLLSQVRTIDKQDLTQQIANQAVPQQVQQQTTQYFHSKYEYQEVVEKITQTLEKYLQIDPLYSKFRPALHTILVPDNLITIPVIVGTKSLPMELLLMCTFLIVAAVENITLDRFENVEKIFQSLQQYLNNESFSQIVTHVTENLPGVKKRRFFKGLPDIRIRKEFQKRQTAELQNVQQDIQSEVLKQLFTSLDQFRIHWKMVLDNNYFERKFGLRINPKDQLGERIFEQVDSNSVRIIEKAVRLYNDELQNKLIDLEITIFNFFQPVNNPKNLVDIVSKLNDGLVGDIIDKVNDNLVKLITKGSKQSGKDDPTSLKVIGEKLLEHYKKDVDKFNEKFEETFRYKLTSNSPQDYEYAIEHIIPQFDLFLSFVRKEKAKYEQLIADYFYSNLAVFLNKEVYKYFKSHVLEAIRAIYSNDEAGYVTFLRANKNITDISTSELDSYLSPIIYNTLYYCYLLCLTGMLGDYLYKSDVEFEIKANEITDFPNYTLVLPLDILEIVHTFLYVRDFKQLLQTKDFNRILQIQTLSLRYIKDVIEYLTGKLRVPNIIVYDNKNRKTYYKFMNQTEVNNVNINTIENFINSVKNI
jgi:hypothetical protein